MVSNTQHGKAALVSSVHTLFDCFAGHQELSQLPYLRPAPEAEIAAHLLELFLHEVETNHSFPLAPAHDAGQYLHHTNYQ